MRELIYLPSFFILVQAGLTMNWHVKTIILCVAAQFVIEFTTIRDLSTGLDPRYLF